MKTYLKTRRDYAVWAFICAFLAVPCLVWLQVAVTDHVRGREEFNAPFWLEVGGVFALIFGIWPPAKFLTGCKKHVTRALVFTVCLAPMPFGPEGTLVPCGFGILCPSLLLEFPQGIILTFATAMFISLAATSLWTMVTGRFPKPGEAEPQSDPYR